MLEEGKRSAEIPSQLSRLNTDEIEAITERLKMLGNKLHPIRSKFDVKPLNEDKPCVQNPSLCEIAALLKDYSTRIESLLLDILLIHTSVEL